MPSSPHPTFHTSDVPSTICRSRRKKMAEIVGLVLAAVPLLISALEHYEKAVDPVVAFFRWRQRLPKVIRGLYMENAAYEQNIRLLLSQATSDAELSDMINNPNCGGWKSADLEDALKDQLGDAYTPCMSTVKEMAKIMVTIAECLNIKGTDQVSHPPTSLSKPK